MSVFLESSLRSQKEGEQAARCLRCTCGRICSWVSGSALSLAGCATADGSHRRGTGRRVGGRDVSSPSLPGRVSCGSVGLHRAVVLLQRRQRLYLSASALFKDVETVKASQQRDFHCISVNKIKTLFKSNPFFYVFYCRKGHYRACERLTGNYSPW